MFKKIFLLIGAIIIFVVSIYYINPISNYLANLIGKTPKLVIPNKNKWTKDINYLYVQNTNYFVPYSNQDLKNIMYTIINNGWNEFTFYCPKEYSNCIKDTEELSKSQLQMTHINNYVHPFNSFTNISTSIRNTGEVTLKIDYLYNDTQRQEIDNKTSELLKKLINDNMSDYDKVKIIHDYIVNNTRYDTTIDTDDYGKFSSNNAYGALFENVAICNGYADLMAIFLTKMGFNNYKIATTPEQISYSSTGHIWNAVFINNKWLHLDLTWDDPVSSDNQNYLYHTYFLINNEALKKADAGERTNIEEHNFNKYFYQEFFQ